MENNEDEGFFNSLSRKELQSFCKQYGLPANRSSSDMAKSLASYLEMQNQRLGSMPARERLYGIQEAELPLSVKLQLQPGAQVNSFMDTGEDCYGLISCPADRCNGRNYSQASKPNALGCCTGQKFCDKDGYSGGSVIFQQTPQSQFVTQCDDCGSKNKEFPTVCFNRNCPSLRDGMMNDMPQIEQKDTNIGACSNETAFHSSINTPIASPSFQFHVSSEEGINLFVDLNSNPSEWVEKLKSEVSICQNMSHSKSQTFHNELGHFGESSTQMKNSFPLDVDAWRIKDGHMHSGLTPSLIIKENNPLQLDHPNGHIVSLGSTVMTQGATTVELSEHLEGDQGLTLSKGPPDSQEQIISSGASSTKDGRLITLDSSINSPMEKLASDAVINISDGPLNILTTEHQNPKLENGICVNSTRRNGCNLVSSVGIRCLPNGSFQMPMPEEVVHQKDILHSPSENGGFVDVVDPNHSVDAEKNELVRSTELDQETFRNRLPTFVEEQGRSKIINCGENSECSQDELFENCGGLDKVESDGLGKKRAYVDGDQNDCNVLDAKILRSSKNLIRKVLPRRSTRLVSKVSL